MEGVKTKPVTVLHAVLENCCKLADKPAISWLNKHCEVVETYTYGELERRSGDIARGLLQLVQENNTQVEAKERIVLYYPPGLEFFIAFLACLRAGVIPVPVNLPEKELHNNLPQIINDCEAMCVLSCNNPPMLAEMVAATNVPWFCKKSTIEIVSATEAAENSMLDKAKPEDVAFLQYTTGPEGNVKGVIINYDNLLHNFKLMKELLHTNYSMIEVSFLLQCSSPCLIGSYLHTLFSGGTGYFMSPNTFLHSPVTWLKALSIYEATHSKVPYFALDYIMAKGDFMQLHKRSFESLCCISCLEPTTSIDTIINFQTFMRLFNMKKNIIRVGYGMEEHVAILSSSITTNEDLIVTSSRISCGSPPSDVIVKIIDPDTFTVVDEGEIGEVCIHSKSKAMGYWGNENLSNQVFRVQLDELSERTYLRTGDLGFLVNGELFISERINNIIHIHGKTIFPSDIENALECITSSVVPLGRSMVFKCDTTEGIDIIMELKSFFTATKIEWLCTEVATQISTKFQVSVSNIIFTHLYSLPSDSFGKRQRLLCKEALKNNEIPVIFRWPSREDRVTKVESTQHPQAKWVISLADGSGMQVTTEISEGATLLMPGLPLPVHENKETSFKTGREPSPIMEDREPASPAKERRSGILYSEEHSKMVKETLVAITTPSLVKEEVESSLGIQHSDLTQKQLPASPAYLPPTPVPSSKECSSSQPHSILESTLPAAPTSRSKQMPPSVPFHNDGNKERNLDACVRRLSVPIQTTSQRLGRITWRTRRSMSEGSTKIGVIERVTKSVSDALGCDVSPNTNIWKDGWNKNRAKKLSLQLCHDYGIVMEEHTLHSNMTLKSLLETVQMSLLNASSNSVLSSTDHHPIEPCLQTVIPQVSVYHAEEPTSVIGTIKNVYGSKCKITLDDIHEAYHNIEDIAIVGMGGSFPGCDGLGDFWKLLTTNQTAIVTGQDSSTGHTYCGGFSTSVGKFDHNWFGLSELEQSSLDPQQAMLLYSTLQCLTSAGFAPRSSPDGGQWGVFVGLSSNSGPGFKNSTAANCIARAFNFTGPTMTIDTAGASSLSALDIGCLNLMNGKCAAAVVCGVNVLLSPPVLSSLNVNDDSKMASPQLESTAAANMPAKEVIPGEGCGAVLLMSIGKARFYDRRILAVIKATSLNDNGADSVAFTAPSFLAHTTLLSRALKDAGLSPKDVLYIESGARDAIEGTFEVDALQYITAVHNYETKSEDVANFVIGSVKANIGYLEGASGIASLIKTVMVLEHAQAPGNRCLQQVNQKFSSKGIVFPLDLVSLHRVGEVKLLTAMVNSFGSTGTNATAVIQQYGLLPHMAGVNCCLLFGPTKDLTNQDILSSLEWQFPIIGNSIAYFDSVLHTISTKFKVNPDHVSNVKILRVYYAMTVQFYTLRARLSAIGGIDALGELVALMFAGSLDLNDVLQVVLLNGVSIDSLQKPFRKPMVPVYTCTRKGICSARMFISEDSLTQYIVEVISRINGECEDVIRHHLQPNVLSNEISELILYFTSEEINSDECEDFIPVSLQQLKDKDSAPQYLRNKYLQLRDRCDKIRIESDSKPSQSEENVISGFYDHYPFRKIIKEKISQSPLI